MANRPRSERSLWMFGVLVACVLASCGWCGETGGDPAGEGERKMTDRTEWFSGRWGVFFHFLGNKAGQREGSKTSAEWNRQVEFMRNIERIHRAWSLRWGRKVSGWWVDGCYLPDVRFPEGDPPNFATLSQALRAGNPDAIIAFNTGVHVPVIVSTKHDDYTAGELAKQLPEEVPGPWLEKDGEKARHHTLSYLGTTWGQGDAPRFDDDFAVRFTKQVTGKGGFVTWDVPPLANGQIGEPFLKQLAAIGAAMNR